MQNNIINNDLLKLNNNLHHENKANRRIQIKQ